MIPDIIFYMIKKGAHKEEKTITTFELAQELNFSQQTASRKLLELEKEGKIRRNGSKIYVLPSTIDEIKKRVRELLRMIDEKIWLKGKISSGLGEGKYYMSQKEYVKQFQKKLYFKPYPGTLNLILNDDQIEKRILLREKEPIIIEGFKTKKRTFGKIYVYRCSLNGIQCAIIFPERSVHGLKTIEIISPYNLREKLNLADGQEVEIEITDNTC
jgi:riboflavin kinase